MSRPLVFMMGKSPAILPVDRRYAANHMWAREDGGSIQLGLSAYAVRLLGDMRHIEWSIAPGDTVEAGRQIGYIEASKATSDLYSPLTGTLEQINDRVLTDPTLINSNLYEEGWLLRFTSEEPELLEPEEYLAHVEASWPLAQRMLKGQAGRQA